MFNQTSSANSEFKMPQAPQPLRTQSESLLFNDILEEINTNIRNELSDFLQSQPYRLFSLELANFFKRINRLKREGQQNGSNISRLTNSSQLVLTNSRPSSSFNFRAPSSMSMISCNRNSTIRPPENHFQPIAPLNPFKPPVHIGLQSNEIIHPRIEQSSYASQGSSNMCTTIVEVSHNNNNTAENNDNCVNLNPPEPVCNISSDPKNAYSDMTVVAENKSNSASHQNDNVNNDSDSIDSLLEAVGFKINVGLPENSKAIEVNDNIIEKYLSKWSVNMKIKSKTLILILAGTLLEADQSTVMEKYHNAGVIMSRKKNDLVKTNNGLYRLVGNIIGGTPDALYQECSSRCGFPMRWRSFLTEYSDFGKKTKKQLLNFSLDSPAAPINSIKPFKKPVNLDMSMTRTGAIYSHNKISRKRKEPDEVSGKSKTKYDAFNKKAPLLASTPKRPKRQPSTYETPTQILKKKIHQNIHNTNSRALKRIDDSINVTKKRRSLTNEQVSKLLKQDSLVKMTKLSSADSTKYSNQTERNSTAINASSLKNMTPSKSKSSDNSSTTRDNNDSKQSLLKMSKNSTKNSILQQSSLKLSKNATKSSILEQSSLKLSINSTKSSNKPTPQSERKLKALQQIKPVNGKSNKNAKNVKPKINCELKKKTNSSTSSRDKVATKQKKGKRSSSPGSDIFKGFDFNSFGDANNIIMLSPGRLSVVSGSEKSRSETPPLFGHEWISSAKSLVQSEPPTPLGKLVEAKALKRINPPKITMNEEIKKNKKINKPIDFITASNKINKFLQF